MAPGTASSTFIEIAEEREKDLRKSEADAEQADEHKLKTGQAAAKANEEVRKVEERLKKLYSTRPLDGREAEQRELDLLALSEHLQVLKEEARQFKGRAHEAEDDARAAHARRLEAIPNAKDAWRVVEMHAELAQQAECRSRWQGQPCSSINTLKTPSAPKRASRLSGNRHKGDGGKRKARGKGGKGHKRPEGKRPNFNNFRLGGPWVAEL